jgi:hypothetical protein
MRLMMRLFPKTFQMACTTAYQIGVDDGRERTTALTAALIRNRPSLLRSILDLSERTQAQSNGSSANGSTTAAPKGSTGGSSGASSGGRASASATCGSRPRLTKRAKSAITVRLAQSRRTG